MALTTIDLASVTEVGGTGSFDVLANELSKRLGTEKSAGRITGQEYANTFIQMMSMALQQALAFELGKAQAAAQADLIRAQITQTEAETLRINSQKQLIDQERSNAVTQGELLQLQKAVVTKEAEKLEKEILQLVAETLQTEKQTLQVEEQTKLITAQVLIAAEEKLKLIAETALIGKQQSLIDSQIIGQTKQNQRTDEEILFTKAKTNTEMANYSESTNAGSVAGVIGKQKLLLEAQTAGFSRNAELGLAKAAMEVFSVMRTTDPDAVDPSTYGLSPSTISAIVGRAKSGVGA